MENMGVEDMINSAFWKGKKVFLTGHTGFKGSWLSIWLNELGAEVCGYALEPNTDPSLFKLANLNQRITSVIGDIRDLPLLQKTMQSFQPDIVIHMAAQPLVKESYENPVDTYLINVMGTVNLLESVRHCSSVKAVVNVTTDKVYENKEWIWGYRETDRLGGYDPYSNSKACSELVTSSYINSFFNKEKYDEHGVAIATARAGNVIGGGDWAKDRLIPDILRAIENNEDIILRNPNAVRPWQHVLEPLSGYLMLCEKLFLKGSKWNGAWNFGPKAESNQTVKRVIEEIFKLMDKEYCCKVEGASNLYESQLLKLEITKATTRLHWKPKWDLKKTLVSILEWNEDYYENKDVLALCKRQINEFEVINK